VPPLRGFHWNTARQSAPSVHVTGIVAAHSRSESATTSGSPSHARRATASHASGSVNVIGVPVGQPPPAHSGVSATARRDRRHEPRPHDFALSSSRAAVHA
jgi:hypothetical protein